MPGGPLFNCYPGPFSIVRCIFDVALISEAIGILQDSLNINDKETHKELTALAMGSVRLHKTARIRGQ